jgi:uncharacterized protein YjiS (DUF1127 family)
VAAIVIPFPTQPVAGRPRDLIVSCAHEPRLVGVAVLKGWLGRWTARRRLERDLYTMTDETLADIGLTRGEALAEARRPFWQAGGHDAG